MVTERVSDRQPPVGGRRFSVLCPNSNVRLLVHVRPGDDVFLHLAALAQIIRGYGRSTTSSWGRGAVWRRRGQRAAAVGGPFFFAFDAAADHARRRGRGRGGRRRGRRWGGLCRVHRRRVAQLGGHHFVAARIGARHVRSAVLVREGGGVFALQVLDLLDLLANGEVVVAAAATIAAAGCAREEVTVAGAAVAAAAAVIEQTAAGRRGAAGAAGAGTYADVRVVVLGLTVEGTGVVLLRANTCTATADVAAGVAFAFYGQRIQWQRTPERRDDVEIKYVAR